MHIKHTLHMTFSYFLSVQSLPLAAALACCFLHISSDIMEIASTLGTRNPLPSKRRLKYIFDQISLKYFQTIVLLDFKRDS